MPSSPSRLLNPKSAERISPKTAQAAQASKSNSPEHTAAPAKLAPAMDSMAPMSSRNSMAPTSLADAASEQQSGYAWLWDCNFRVHAEFQRRGEHGHSTRPSLNEPRLLPHETAPAQDTAIEED